MTLEEKIYTKLGIKNDKNLKIIRPVKETRVYDSKYNTYNFGCLEVDVAVMPYEKQDDFKYMFLFVDLKSRILFPVYTKKKDKDASFYSFEQAYGFYKKIIVIAMDQGGEFHNTKVQNLLKNNGTAFYYGMTNRRFNSVVEYYIGRIKKYVLEKLSVETIKSQDYKLDWRDYATQVIQEINNYNKDHYPKAFILEYGKFLSDKNMLKVGDMVHVKLDHPITILNDKRIRDDYYRHGDLRFTKETYPISSLVYRPGDSSVRYKIKGYAKKLYVGKTSFKRNELLKSD